MVDFNKIKTVSIQKRTNKFTLDKIVSLRKSKILSDNKDLVKLSKAIKKARENDKQVILMMGAHPIKLGLSLFLIDLMKKDMITHLATNGAGAIHDFEIALIGETSEDVQRNLKNGTFGMAEETGYFLNKVATIASRQNLGLGYSIGVMGSALILPYKKFSLFYNAYKLNIPSTVHTAIGAEIIYQYPNCDAAALGKSSYQDFKILTDSVSKLEKGVVINLGSAVIMPEVFLKSLAIVRNLKYKVARFTSANLDMKDQHRPRKNVVERPASFGGKGFNIIEKHEKTIPTLHKLLTTKNVLKKNNS